MNERKLFAIILIGIITIILGLAAFQFLGGIVGAIILFTLLHPLYKRLAFSPAISATLVIITSIVILLVPFILLGSMAVQEIIELNQQQTELKDLISKSFTELDIVFPGLEIEKNAVEVIQSVTSYLEELLSSIIQNIITFFINIVLMYILLYFMLTEQAKWEQAIYDFLPYSQANSKKLLTEFGVITNATIISGGVVALVQGILLGLSFWATGIQNPLFWGFVGTLVSFLPIIGSFLLWIPASLYLFFTGNIFAGVALILFNVIITSNIDNVLRPIINKKVGNIHPVTSLVGIFFGLQLFGIAGLILGPLLISYFFLSMKIFRDEYK